MFVRPAMPVNAATASLRVTQDDLQSYIKQFEVKLKPFIEFKERLETDQARKLGIKDQRDEIEKFIKVNTQELAAERWLCPLSGKRFKGPEFIRKHLFYKHMDKIIEVKKEVWYFNNYVYDPKRPQLPEHPSNRPGGGSSGPASSNSNQQSGHQQSSPVMQNAYQPMQAAAGFGYNQSPYANNGPGLLGNQPNVNMMGAQLPHQFGQAMANVGRMGGAWSAGGFGDIGGAGSFGSPGFMPQAQFAGMGGGGYGGQQGGGGYRGGRGGYSGGYNRRGGG